MTRRSDGRWQEAIMIDGKRKYFYGKSKAEVLRKIREHEEKAKSGQLFPAVAREWWNKHESSLSPNTQRGYVAALKRAEHYFAKTDVAAIRPVDVSRFLAKMIAEHTMAEKTAKTQLLVMNLLLRYATETGYIDANPAADLRVPKHLRKEKRDMASHDDLAIIKDSLHIPFGFYAYFILCTGLRRSEALALQWKDIDINRRMISVNKSIYYVGNTPFLKSPKTEAGKRTVPIINALMPYLTPGYPEEYVFTSPEFPGDPLHKHTYERYWDEYCKESGVRCTPHQIRHAYVTMLWEAGIEPEIAMKMTGHAQISTMRDIYTHIRDSKLAEEREKLHDIDLPS